MRLDLFNELFLLQRIDHLIRTRATGSPKRLAGLLNISECSVYRLIENLREHGFPVAYDKTTRTYYYTAEVRWNVEFLVGGEKLLAIKGGENIFQKNAQLSISDRMLPELCTASPNYGAQ
jgi:hypothetical protein